MTTSDKTLSHGATMGDSIDSRTAPTSSDKSTPTPKDIMREANQLARMISRIADRHGHDLPIEAISTIVGVLSEALEKAYAVNRLAIKRLQKTQDGLVATLQLIDAMLCDRELCGHFTAEELRECVATALKAGR